MKGKLLLRLGGVLELISAGLVVISFILAGTAGLTEMTPQPAEMGQWLQDVGANHNVYVANSWSLIINHLLEIIFFLALFYVLQDISDTMWIAVVTGSFGLLLVSVSGIFQIGLGQLAAYTVEAGSREQAAILPVAVALERIRLATNISGTVLAWGVGGVIFVLGMLRNDDFARWLSYLGLVIFALIWVSAFQLIWPALEVAFLGAVPLMLVWLVGMSLTLLRMPVSELSGRVQG